MHKNKGTLGRSLVLFFNIKYHLYTVTNILYVRIAAKTILNTSDMNTYAALVDFLENFDDIIPTKQHDINAEIIFIAAYTVNLSTGKSPESFPETKYETTFASGRIRIGIVAKA